MVASAIKVFLRIRPSARPSKAFKKSDEGVVSFDLDQVRKVSADWEVNNNKATYQFKLDHVLDMKTTQEEVFDLVAKPVIEDVLNGINGTIFAYGQSGSGKTFTITGGAERYADRGLIPRTIAYLFEAFRQRHDATYRLHVSYLEIYNNEGYDLLSRDDSARRLEDLPKVTLREDEEGNTHLRNLDMCAAPKAEDALNLLFVGDTNRVVAETPLNDASTRSHCMFILWVESSQAGSDTVRRAKLHLVDLAGSERLSKTGAEGKLATEAKQINLSLHYLEQVIVALHDRAQGRATHVPYRNSMMTSVLRDSLGGNCRTVMVGTLAVEDTCVDESISTCRFAQRVACVKNNASINEELDPALLIKRLKKQVAELKDELKLLNSDGEEELTERDREECQKLVATYLAESDLQAAFVCGSSGRFRECFRILKETYGQRRPGGLPPAGQRGAGASRVAAPSGGAALGTLEAMVRELRQQVQQRDEEISMLLSSLGKRSKAREAQAAAKDGPVFIKAAAAAPAAQGAAAGSGGASTGAPPDAAALLLDRNQAFEVFRKSMRRSETLEGSKEATRRLVAEAKEMGEKANGARAAIAERQRHIEKLRMERALECNPRDVSAERPASPLDGPEVAALLAEIEEHKRTYHKCTERLKQAKEKIDAYRQSAEQNKERMQRDFEAWFAAAQAATASAPGPTLQGPAGGSGLPAPAATPAPAAAPAPALAAPAQGPGTLTGHAQTDGDIAELFAAVASLRSWPGMPRPNVPAATASALESPAVAAGAEPPPAAQPLAAGGWAPPAAAPGPRGGGHWAGVKVEPRSKGEDLSEPEKIERRVMWLNRNGRLAKHMDPGEVLPALDCIGFRQAMRVLRRLEEAAATVADPDEFVKDLVARSGWIWSKPDVIDDDEKVAKRVAWINQFGGLSQPIDYAAVADILDGLKVAHAMVLLRELEVQAHRIDDPTEYIRKTASLAGEDDVHIPLVDQGSSIAQRVAQLNESGVLARAIEVKDVGEDLARLGDEAAMQLLREVELKGSSVKDPTGFLKFKLKAKLATLSGATLEEVVDDETKILKRVEWLNDYGGLQQDIDYNSVAARLKGAGLDAAMAALKELEDGRKSLADPTAFLLACPRLAVQRPARGRPAPPTAAGAAEGADLQAVTRFVGFLNRNSKLKKPVKFSDVASAMDSLGPARATKVLQEMQEKGLGLDDPVAYIRAKAQQAAPFGTDDAAEEVDDVGRITKRIQWLNQFGNLSKKIKVDDVVGALYCLGLRQSMAILRGLQLQKSPPARGAGVPDPTWYIKAAVQRANGVRVAPPPAELAAEVGAEGDGHPAPEGDRAVLGATGPEAALRSRAEYNEDQGRTGDWERGGRCPPSRLPPGSN
ncbi:unnamed protein product [Prorocentrum cordatum]|uniref:Kinesin motor domain-containing protein n=1 Tax=Prorocentrum cordatum TaxID=2364126 RepID=A0ABN9UY18_9DINO|nr:unnamed protein product [Polarella glacialis]